MEEEVQAAKPQASKVVVEAVKAIKTEEECHLKMLEASNDAF